jgi:hypothetical protein
MRESIRFAAPPAKKVGGWLVQSFLGLAAFAGIVAGLLLAANLLHLI